MKNGIGRRDALRLIVVGSAAALAGCGGSSNPTCTDTAGMSSADIQFRNTNAYVDVSVRPDNCATCTFFTAGAAAACGTCTLVRGPISPAGYCNLFSRRPT
jgi:hypothetical protein